MWFGDPASRGAAAIVLLALGCASATTVDPSGAAGASGCPAGKVCHSGNPSGTPRPLRTDGTVDVTPKEAWPNRATEPAPLSAEELLAACAAYAACADVDPTDGDVKSARRLMQSLCLKPPEFYEERAVPITLPTPLNERWTYQAREAIEAGGNCALVMAASTRRPAEIFCEEVGCWWTSPKLPIPKVTCAGDVATLATGDETFTRDCSRALTRCDPSSPTGCTDRAPTGCVHPAKDRCDGDIRLGCDGTGRLSFHDCSRVLGGVCADTAAGPACVYPSADCAPGTPQGCNGTILRGCVLESAVGFDCVAGGFASCEDGLCVAK